MAVNEKDAFVGYFSKKYLVKNILVKNERIDLMKDDEECVCDELVSLKSDLWVSHVTYL